MDTIIKAIEMDFHLSLYPDLSQAIYDGCNKDWAMVLSVLLMLRCIYPYDLMDRLLTLPTEDVKGLVLTLRKLNKTNLL